jgi:hypothetical protein
MFHCAVGCLVSDISKEHSTSIIDVNKSLFWTADPEEEGTLIICIVKNYTHHDMMSQLNGI